MDTPHVVAAALCLAALTHGPRAHAEDAPTADATVPITPVASAPPPAFAPRDDARARSLPRYTAPVVVGAIATAGIALFGGVMLAQPTGVQQQVGGVSLLPVVGPFIATGMLYADNLTNPEIYTALLVTNGLMQTLAAALTVRAAVVRASAPQPRAQWSVTPWVTPSAVGASATLVAF